MDRIRAAVSVGLALGGLLVAGCSGGDGAGASGARMGEVGEAFGQEAQKAADDFYSFFRAYEGELEVTNDGKTDMPCELSGEVKRRYDASFLALERGTSFGFIFRPKINTYDADYTINKVPDQASDTPEAELRRKDKPYTLVIKVDRSAKVRVTIHAETDCLDAG